MSCGAADLFELWGCGPFWEATGLPEKLERSRNACTQCWNAAGICAHPYCIPALLACISTTFEHSLHASQYIELSILGCQKESRNACTQCWNQAGICAHPYCVPAPPHAEKYPRLPHYACISMHFYVFLLQLWMRYLAILLYSTWQSKSGRNACTQCWNAAGMRTGILVRIPTVFQHRLTRKSTQY